MLPLAKYAFESFLNRSITVIAWVWPYRVLMNLKSLAYNNQIFIVLSADADARYLTVDEVVAPPPPTVDPRNP